MDYVMIGLLLGVIGSQIWTERRLEKLDRLRKLLPEVGEFDVWPDESLARLQSDIINKIWRTHTLAATAIEAARQEIDASRRAIEARFNTPTPPVDNQSLTAGIWLLLCGVIAVLIIRPHFINANVLVGVMAAGAAIFLWYPIYKLIEGK